MPLCSLGTTLTATSAITGFSRPTPDAGDQEAAEQRRSTRRPCSSPDISSRPTPAPSSPTISRSRAWTRDSSAPAIGATRNDSDRDRQVAQPGLERRVAEEVLQVERQVEEQREHRARDAKAASCTPVKAGRGRGRAAASARARAARSRRTPPSAAPPPASSETISVLPQPSSLPRSSASTSRNSEPLKVTRPAQSMRVAFGSRDSRSFA